MTYASTEVARCHVDDTVPERPAVKVSLSGKGHRPAAYGSPLPLTKQDARDVFAAHLTNGASRRFRRASACGLAGLLVCSGCTSAPESEPAFAVVLVCVAIALGVSVGWQMRGGDA